MAQSIPSQTITLFRQAWVPVNWTRELKNDDGILRVTNTPGVVWVAPAIPSPTDGLTAFNNKPYVYKYPTQVIASADVAPAVGELNAHSHTATHWYGAFNAGPKGSSNPLYQTQMAFKYVAGGNITTSTAGGTAVAHTHPWAVGVTPSVDVTQIFNVRYIDAILAKRN